MNAEPEREPRRKGAGAIALPVILVVLAMVLLRCIALDSDAYPRLSWSSALLTDEGFYIHNARNLVLFGQSQTDQFSNALIMPWLNLMQVGVFRLFGVGAIQARSISIVLGLLTVGIFFDAMRRAFGTRAALFSGLLLGLDHLSLLYSRLALMDTPASFVLVCAFWCWVRSGEQARRRIGWLLVCGLVLGFCYGVRGLGALLYPIPILLLAREGWKVRRQAKVGEAQASLRGVLTVISGLIVALGAYVVLWYLPNRAELARVNHYYLFDQLVPHSLRGLGANVMRGLFGDHRGLVPFLLRHEPVPTCLAIFWLIHRACLRKEGTAGSASIPATDWPEKRRLVNADFLALWLLVFWLLLLTIDYSPSRYYVLFLPAFYGLTGLTLSDVSVFRDAIRNRAMAAIIGLLGFHYAQSAWHHLGGQGVLWPTAIGVGCLFAFAVVRAFQKESSEQSTRALRWERLAPAALLLWSLFDLYWTGDWLLHLTYRQRDADRWLAQHLPADSVLIGAVAPGLALDNRFVCVNVIEKLCNDQQPVEKYAPAPRYILILDDQWKEWWWRRTYPDLVAPEKRIHAFRGLLRPYFVIGLYRVPDEIGRKR